LEAVLKNALGFMQHRETSFDKVIGDVEKQFGIGVPGGPTGVPGANRPPIESRGGIPGGQKPSEERQTIGGKSYIKRNGDWYKE
jgi:hypothetical protein